MSSERCSRSACAGSFAAPGRAPSREPCRPGLDHVGRARCDVPAARCAGPSASTSKTFARRWIRPTPRSRVLQGSGQCGDVPRDRAVIDRVRRAGSRGAEKDVKFSETTCASTTPRTIALYGTGRAPASHPHQCRKGMPQPISTRRRQGRIAARRRAQKPCGIRRPRAQEFAGPGSAEKGGDLDFFGRGAMVKPFRGAAFRAERPRDERLVQSDFGYPSFR